MKRMGWTAAWVLTAGLAVVLLLGVARRGQQTLQQGFEGRDPLWVKGAADAAFQETAHRITDEFARGGRRSEYIELDADQGSYIYYTYDIGKAPIGDELNVSVWVKANRPGIQLLCRAVLPQEHDPQNLDQPLTTLLKGDEYQITGRWQQLTLQQPVKRLREQLQLLRADQNHDVIGADAYIDRLVLNVWSGKGATQVWIDDLEVSPIEEVQTAATRRRRRPAASPERLAVNRRPDTVQLEGKQLLVDGKPFFPRIIRHTGTPPKTLYDAGFNVIALDETSPPGLLEEAVALGFRVMPTVAAPPPADPLLRRRAGRAHRQRRPSAARCRASSIDGSVLSWDAGSSLTSEQFQAVSHMAQTFHAVDPMRPVSVDVSDGFQRYSPRHGTGDARRPPLAAVDRHGADLLPRLADAAAAAGPAGRLLLDVGADARPGLVPGAGLRPRRAAATPSRSARRPSRSA